MRARSPIVLGSALALTLACSDDGGTQSSTLGASDADTSPTTLPDTSDTDETGTDSASTNGDGDGDSSSVDAIQVEVREITLAELLDWIDEKAEADLAKKGMFPLTRRVHGKRAGVLGLGRIGYEIARRLQGFPPRRRSYLRARQHRSAPYRMRLRRFRRGSPDQIQPSQLLLLSNQLAVGNDIGDISSIVRLAQSR